MDVGSRSKIEFHIPLRIEDYGLIGDCTMAAWSAGTVLSTGCAGLDSIARPASLLCWEAQSGPIRTFIFALAATVPSFGIDQAGAGTGAESCTRDETGAKNELAKRWSQFGASEKKACIGESSIGGDQSYVELAAVREMFHVARLDARHGRSALRARVVSECVLESG